LDVKIIAHAHNTLQLKKGARLRNLLIQIKGKNNTLIIHEDAYVVGEIQLFGDNNHMEIGRRTRVTGAQLAAFDGTKLLIGEGCMFGMEIDIRTSDNHPIFNEAGERINPDKDVIIQDRVWLAKGVSVLKGAFIESDCVVGFRSVVTKRLPKNSVCGGSPARVLKTGITWKR
jgi:acetyltransferase-like isoleucine patch superfamily enzyme